MKKFDKRVLVGSIVALFINLLLLGGYYAFFYEKKVMSFYIAGEIYHVDFQTNSVQFESGKKAIRFHDFESMNEFIGEESAEAADYTLFLEEELLRRMEKERGETLARRK